MGKVEQSGIALIQVLLIAAIISVFALSMTQNARKQVKIAQMTQDRLSARIELNNATELLLLALVSESWEPLAGEPEIDEPLTKIPFNWNFHNEPFNLSNNVVARIQDQSALLSLYLIDRTRMKRFFIANGLSEQRAEQIIAHLIDWQDSDSVETPLGSEQLNSIISDNGGISFLASTNGRVRNGYISDISELHHVLRLTNEEKILIENNFTTYFYGDLNPLTASREMLLTFGDDSVVQQLLTMRNEERLKQSDFKLLTSNNSDDLRFYPANVFNIKLQSKINQVNIEHEVVVAISPYASNGAKPFTVLSHKY